MKMSFTIVRVRGIPIKVHITLLLFLPFLMRELDPVYGLIMAIGMFTCIALHELGHSLVALRMGCLVREILLLPIGGVAQMSNAPSRPRDEFFMAAAGPAVSFLLAAIFFVMGRYIPLKMLTEPGYRIVTWLAIANLGWVIFNLIPAFPMDGGRILRAWLSPFMGRLRATYLASFIGKIIAAGFVIAGWHWHSWSLIFIGLFVFYAAGQEYRAILMQERPRPSIFGMPIWSSNGMHETRNVDGVTVGPPPYEDRGQDSSEPPDNDG